MPSILAALAPFSTRLTLAVVGAATAFSLYLLGADAASAQTQTGTDYSALTSGVSSEVNKAVPLALTAVGLIIGIFVAYKVIRRLLRA